MPSRHIETRNIVFPKRQVRGGSCQHENINSRRTKSMSRTIEAIMRHMAPPPSRVTDQSNRIEKLEKEITVQKRHHIWSESRFVRIRIEGPDAAEAMHAVDHLMQSRSDDD